jgi:hypothetical protein
MKALISYLRRYVVMNALQLLVLAAIAIQSISARDDVTANYGVDVSFPIFKRVSKCIVEWSL